MHTSTRAAARHAATGLVAAVVCVLSVLLAGCATTGGGTSTAVVETIYAEAQGVSPEQMESRKAHDVAVLEWAVDLDLAEPWTESELRRNYDAGTGQTAFGATDMSFWDFYTERIGQTEDLLKTHIRDSISLDEVRTYYESHIEEFARQDILDVTVMPWQGGRAGDAYTLTIDEESVRLLQEQDDELIAAALELQQGEETLVDLDDDTYFQVTCTSRVDAGYEPFDDVTQAALSQLTTERFNIQIQQRLDTVDNG